MQTFRFSLMLAVALASLPKAGVAEVLEFPAPVLAMAARSDAHSSYAVPTGPFDKGKMTTRIVEGSVRQRAVRLDAKGASTLQLLAPLRDQLAAAGYSVLYECAAFDCGGFDFRYGMEVLPEPDMHVDLGDYRYLAAERAGGAEVVAVLISRSTRAGFVQVVEVGAAGPDAAVTASSKSPDATLVAEPADPVPRVDQVPGKTLVPDQTLVPDDTLVLDDLVFASGAHDLVPGDYPTLTVLASRLREDPGLRVLLRGHTDSSGDSDTNLTLSERRAETVRDVLEAAGISRARITVKGLGPTAPRADNATAEGRRLNRRVEAVLSRN